MTVGRWMRFNSLVHAHTHTKHRTFYRAYSTSGLEFFRFDYRPRDISRPYFQSLSLGVGLEAQSLGLGR